jgi:hypothetical protein
LISEEIKGTEKMKKMSVTGWIVGAAMAGLAVGQAVCADVFDELLPRPVNVERAAGWSKAESVTVVRGTVAGAPKKDFLGKSIGRLVENAMEERRAFINNYDAAGSREMSIIADDKGEDNYRFSGEVICPIIAQGDPIGTVIICDKNGSLPQLGDAE